MRISSLLQTALWGIGLALSATAPSSQAREPLATPVVAVGSQYDTTHVYVAPAEIGRASCRERV